MKKNLSLKENLKSLKARNAVLRHYVSNLKRGKKRMLLGDLMDKFEEPRYDLMPLIMPVSIPQVSDARINVQTFNPPSMPLEPGMLPEQNFSFKIKAPEVHRPDKRSKEVNLTFAGKFNSQLKNVIGRAFSTALEKHRNAHLGDFDRPRNYIINVFDTPTERELSWKNMKDRIEGLISRIRNLKDQIAIFDNQVDNKMKFVEFLISKYQQIKLNYIFDVI